MRADRSFQLIEAVADRFEGAPVWHRRRWSESFKAEIVRLRGSGKRAMGAPAPILVSMAPNQR
jgi:transposase-like protein